MTAIRLLAALALPLAFVPAVALALAAPAGAQVVHRSGVPAGDAMPTGAAFTIRFPVPFKDLEGEAEEPGVPGVPLRMVTGVSEDGIRFTATEMPYAGRRPEPMERFAEAVKAAPGWSVTELRRDDCPPMQVLSFSVTSPTGAYYFRMLRANDTRYMLVIQFPEAQRAKAAAMREAFFSSFRLLHQ